MTRTTLIALLLLVGVAAPAQAKKPKPYVGIGEQNPQLFSDTRWIDLEKPDVRYVASWDALRTVRGRAEVDLWMRAAEFRHARVLLSFGHSRRSHRWEKRLPTVKQFRREFKKFRKRYPFIRTYQTWNEANHGSQPTWKRPGRVGKFFDMLKKTCRRCTITAPSVLDDGQKMVRWIKKFRKAAKKPVRVWALHNHIDANRNRTVGTRLFLRNTKGKVWFTETGGIWNRWVRGKKVRRYTHKQAVRAIRNIFTLARLNRRRVQRIYVYHWFAPAGRRPRWDSGLVGPKGGTRKTLKTLKAQIRRYGRR
jgi:hypothetical protein